MTPFSSRFSKWWDCFRCISETYLALEKIQAFDALVNSFWILPRHKCDEILIKLAQNNQPTEVRFHVALSLLKGPHIDNNTYQALVHTLVNRN
jgi:hypothetical protein